MCEAHVQTVVSFGSNLKFLNRRWAGPAILMVSFFQHNVPFLVNYSMFCVLSEIFSNFLSVFNALSMQNLLLRHMTREKSERAERVCVLCLCFCVSVFVSVYSKPVVD